MMNYLLSHLVCSFAILASGQLASGNVPCCPADSVLINNSCYIYQPPGQYFLCDPNDVYDPTTKICANSYLAVEGVPCKDGYVLEVTADRVQMCIKRYDARPNVCPEGFVLNSQRMCEKVVDSACPSTEPSPLHPYDPLPSSDMQMSPSMTSKTVQTIAERTMSASITPKPVESSATPSITSKTVQTIAERTMSSSMTSKPAEPSATASQTPKVAQTIAERTMSSSMTPKRTCDVWTCPDGYELIALNGKVICKYYKYANYNIITLPADPEGNVGYYNEYYCPNGTKLILIANAVESEKYFCEGYANVIGIACPSQSPHIRSPLPFPSPIYKTFTRGPSRRPIFYQSSVEFTGAIADALINPIILKKFIIGLSCAINDHPLTINIKDIIRKINGISESIPFTLPQIDEVAIDCIKMYASPSTPAIVSPATRRQLQTTENVQIVYGYQPTDPLFTPAPINIASSALLNEVALDISNTNESSAMVAYSLTQDATIATNQNAQISQPSDTSDISRNAITGIVVGCMALGVAMMAGIIGYKTMRRSRREKLMGSKSTINPATAMHSEEARWASAPVPVNIV